MVTSICNYLKINEKLSSSGQPGRDQFGFIKTAGFEVVINLALDTSRNALPDEKQIVQSYNMDYVHIPVIWEDPLLVDMAHFLEVMNVYTEKSVFLHCALNYRASVFAALYLMINKQIKRDEGLKMIRKIWEPDAVWLKFYLDILAEYAII